MTVVLVVVGVLVCLVSGSTAWKVLNYRARHRQPDGSLDEPPYFERLLYQNILAFCVGVALLVWAAMR